MFIGFEAKRFFKNFTGLGNYSRFIITALSDYCPDNQHYLYTPTIRSHPELDALLRRPNIRVVHPRGLYGRFGGSVWRTWGIGNEESVRELQIFHGLSQELPISLPNTVKKVVTVHDLIFMRFPEFYSAIDARIYTAKVKYACKHADRIVAISNQTATDIVNFLGVDRSKIDIIYQGCHPSFKRMSTREEIEDLKSRYRLPERYLLNVGTIEKRKNALLIVKSLLHIPETSRLPLVLVGKETSYSNQIKAFVVKHRLEKWVTFLHNASFKDFPAIYQGAEVFIYPSLFEGFGIPIVEAIESRVPVITSSGTAFTEAAGPHASYIDPADPEHLAAAIKRITDDNGLRKKMVTESLLYAQRFQPSVIAGELSRLYYSMTHAG